MALQAPRPPQRILGQALLAALIAPGAGEAGGLKPTGADTSRYRPARIRTG